jgi:hypothetical protein
VQTACSSLFLANWMRMWIICSVLHKYSKYMRAFKLVILYAAIYFYSFMATILYHVQLCTLFISVPHFRILTADGDAFYYILFCMKKHEWSMCVGSDNILWARSWRYHWLGVAVASSGLCLLVSALKGCCSKCFPSLETRR